MFIFAAFAVPPYLFPNEIVYVYFITIQTGFGFGSNRPKEGHPRSPGPIYDPDSADRTTGTYRIDSAGRTLSGSIYEFGYNNPSPGPTYNIDKDFQYLDRYRSVGQSLISMHSVISLILSYMQLFNKKGLNI